MSRYATPEDMHNLAMPMRGLAPYQTATVQQLHLDTASDTIDTYLANQVTLPLTGTIPLSIKMKVCQIAAWTLLVQRGYSPQNPDDDSLKAGYDTAMDWLVAVSKGEIKPIITDSSPSGLADGGPDVLQVTAVPGGVGSRSLSNPSGTGSGRGGFVIGSPRLRGF